jgi:antirestriction protein
MHEYHPRIYVASLSDYNGGRLVGAWIDADQDADAIHAEIADMLKAAGPGREEWAIHDYEDFGQYCLSEYEDIATIGEIARGLVEFGDAFAAFLAIGYDDPAEVFEDHFIGTYDSVADWAEEWAEMEGFYTWRDAMPENSLCHYAAKLDVEECKMIATCNWGWSFVEHGGSTHIFSN